MNHPRKRLALFWGCLIPYRLPWIERAARKILPKLGLEIVDLPFSCCPDPIASRALDHLTWLSLAARNLCLAEEQPLDILTLCSGCFETLKTAQSELSHEVTKESVNRILAKANRHYEGSIEVFHLQQYLYEKIGLEDLEKLISHPLQLRVATHVGCHFTRPGEILQTDDPIYPEKLDELCGILGLDSVDYPDKNLCCGVGTAFIEKEIAHQLIKRKIEGIHKAECKALVAHCPACIQTYDSGQKLFRQKDPEPIEPVPIFHYLELLGLAMGFRWKEFAFDEHAIPIQFHL